MVKTNQPPESKDLRDFEESAMDKNWVVRRGVARNSDAPAHILGKLSCDEKWKVRDYRIYSEKAPSSTSKEVGRGGCQVALNPSTPPEILVNLRG